MKLHQLILLIAGLLFLSVSGYAQLRSPETSDSIVQLAADSQGLSPIAPLDLPIVGGTYWWVLPGGMAVPAPCLPPDASAVYQIAEGQFLVDDTGGQVSVSARQFGSQAKTATVASAVAMQANAMVNLITQIQTRTATEQTQRMMMAMDEGPPSPGGEGSGGSYTNSYFLYTFDTNQFWLEMVSISNGVANLNLHNATNQIYAIWTTTNVLNSWQVETEVQPTDITAMPFTLLTAGRDHLFVRAEDWTGVFTNGLPIWWEWSMFGNFNQSGTDLDSEGHTLAFDSTNNINPQFIQFSLQFTNAYIREDSTIATIGVSGIAPDYEAVLFNDTNIAAAVWQSYSSSNITVNFTTNGLYTVIVGLKRVPAGAMQLWARAQVTYDTVPPVLTITNPVVGTTVSMPLLQLQGLVNESLSSLTYDISNALGVVTNQPGYWSAVSFDTNSLLLTTNVFQCYDVSLTNGVNTLTLYATDLAGNSTTTNFSYTYSPPTTPPVLTLLWPQNNAMIAGSNMTVQAQMSEATATVWASIGTNAVQGIVERSGLVWFNDLPLNSGTNRVTLTATNVAGLTATTNFNVTMSAVNVTIDPISEDELNQSILSHITGEVSDTNYDVWINGVQVIPVNDGEGGWYVDFVPVEASGAAKLDIEVYPAGTTDNPIAEQQIIQEQPAMVQLMSYQESSSLHKIFEELFQAILGQAYDAVPATTDDEDNTVWSYFSGGVDVGYENFSGAGWHGDNGGWNESDPAYYDSWDNILEGGADGFDSMAGDAWENVRDGYSREYGSGYNSDNRQVQTRVMILPPAQQGIGQTALYLVQAQITNEDTGLKLPSTVVRYMNQMAGTTTQDVTNDDGSVWATAMVSGPSGAPVEVTPTMPGNIDFSQMKTAKTKQDWQADVHVEINQDSGYTAVLTTYLAENGFSYANRRDIKAVYAWYQKVYLEQPTEYYWCGLAKLAGAPVYAGLSDAQQSYPALEGFQQTIIQMNIDILNDLAWQWEAYRKGGLQALEAIYAVDKNALDDNAIGAWREIDQGIQQNNQTLILEGNKDLLKREQQQVLPDDYAVLSSFDTVLMSIFAKCPVWNSSSVPYPARDFNTIMSNLGYGSFNIANTDNRWTWITTSTFGIWDTWMNLSSDDKISQVSSLLTTRAVTYSTLPSALFYY